MPAPETLWASLERAAAVESPRDGLGFLDRDERAVRLRFAEVRDRALRVAGGLRAAGVRAGDRVAIVLPTAPSFVDVFFGCQAAGATPVPLYPPVRLGRLDEYVDATAAMLRATGAAALVSDARVRLLLGRVVARARPPLGTLLPEDLLAAAPATPHAASPADLAMVQFSSGTTVDPKPVALSQGAVLANAGAILRYLPLDEPHAGVSWLPLYHDMGLIGCIFPAVLRPGPLTLIPPELFLARPAIWLRTISRERATISPAPNFAYALCAERVRDEDLAGCDLSSWRLALNGAEPISPGTMRAFIARFGPFGLRAEALTPVYGLSEAALAVTFSDPRRPFRSERFDRAALASGHAILSHSVASAARAERSAEDRSSSPRADRSAEDPSIVHESAAVELPSVGPPLPGFGVAVRGPGGRQLAAGEVGRIFVEGPSLMSGYLDGRPSPIAGGWLDTGDLGFLLDGELFVTGRAKDILILRGRNHAPQDVERAVDGVAGVRTGCAAAAAEIGERGERLLLFVEARAPRRRSARSGCGVRDAEASAFSADCRRAVLAATGLELAHVVILPAGTLPRTSSGKIRRGETLRRWQRGELRPPARIGRIGMARAVARSVLAYVLGR